MSIASRIFLLAFLPIIVSIYLIILKNPRWKLYFLFGTSFLFIAFLDVTSLVLILFLSAITFISGISKTYFLGISINALVIISFKLSDFAFSQFPGYFEHPLASSFVSLGIPLGISYVVFKHIGYLIDLLKNRQAPTRDLLSFGTFSLFFPQITAGPISNFSDTGKQLSDLPRQVPPSKFGLGLIRITFGLAKKILIADVLGIWLTQPANNIGAVEGFLPAWLILVAFSIQLYFDFSGYSDMAIGVALLFGIDLPENFNNPYTANTYRDFWERWHISLSQWFRVYIFYPLSRSLLGKVGRVPGQLVANLLTIGLIGLWHGTALGFILWGLYHGAMLTLSAWLAPKTKPVLPPFFSHVLFLISIMIGWAFFMSPDFSSMRHFFSQLVGMSGLGNTQVLNELWQGVPYATAIFAGAGLALLGLADHADKELHLIKRWGIPLFLIGLLFIFSILILPTEIRFLYGQF